MAVEGDPAPEADGGTYRVVIRVRVRRMCRSWVSHDILHATPVCCRVGMIYV